MNRKPGAIVSFLAVLGLVFGIQVARQLSAAPVGDFGSVHKVATNDGDTKVPVNVVCSSSAWTSLLSARPKRRVASLMNLTTNSDVCLSTSTSGGTCYPATTDPSHGVIQAGGSFTEHSESVVFCKAKASSASASIYGTDEYDSGD